MGNCMAKKRSGNNPEQIEQQRRRLSVNQVAEPVPPEKVEQQEPVASTARAANVLDLLGAGQASWRASSCGVLSTGKQAGFENKGCLSEGESLGSLGIGHVCKKGLKPESPNQDDFCVFSAGSSSLFGVFDGHGPYGHDLSYFVQETLPCQFLQASSFSSGQAAKALGDAFPETHRLALESQAAGRFDCTLSGTTATIAFLDGDMLHLAHVGDSRAVLARKVEGEARECRFASEDLTNDHKPTCEAEKQRVLAAGGQVLRLEGDIPHRVFLKGKLYPGLAMTRSIGDTVGSTAGISCEAEVRSLPRQPDWQFMLLCSDGIWEFVSSQEAVDIVSRYPASKAQEAAEALASEAWGRWIQEEGNVVDDITVVLSWFKQD
eukprot:TRINITY_DN39239_c0_g1_i1.p1 TRINITY_DN39239_c0_g1~~TRINITY_DN39239_c0_g1_i1.p1  ORF type:complete len:377 (+),score=93.52 TRINITY_DN39239_c0_g1_i1:86-1216(+)